MADYRLVMSLLYQGRSYREIVERAGCSHREVSTTNSVMTAKQITPERLASFRDAEVLAL